MDSPIAGDASGIPEVIRNQIKPCDVLCDFSNVELECKRYMARNRPVLLKGAAKDWEACRKWSLEYFRDGKLGSTMVDVSLDGREKGKKERQSLRDYITGFTNPSSDSCKDSEKFPPYMRAWFFPEEEGGSELLSDFPNPPPYFPDKFKKLDPQFQPPFTWLFIGPKGAYSPLHRDIWFTCAWMAQLEGRKRFIFFSPSDVKHVYSKENGQEQYLDLSAASTPEDWAKFPRAADTRPIEAVLEPGDVLYIPSKWAHFVESLTPSVSLTCNFANQFNFKHVLMQAMTKAAAGAGRADGDAAAEAAAAVGAGSGDLRAEADGAVCADEEDSDSGDGEAAAGAAE